VHEGELRHCFADGWRVDTIEDSVLEITLDPGGAQAWLGTFTRV
jgi:hypothetical protein